MRKLYWLATVALILQSCGGDDGVNGHDGIAGADGADCSAIAMKDSSGYQMICGEDSVGTLMHGTNGTDGTKGEAGKTGPAGPKGDKGIDGVNGENGDDGENGKILYEGSICELRDTVDAQDPYHTGLKYICGDSVKVVWTTMKSFDLEEIQICGNALFNTQHKFCEDGKLVDLCGSKSYNTKTEFCAGEAVYKLCNGKTYDVATSFCTTANVVTDKCEGKAYDVATQRCFNDTLYKSKPSWNYLNPKIDYKIIRDERDGQYYATVAVGKQVWMAENLNYTDSVATPALKKRRVACYGYSQENCNYYGALYYWVAALNCATPNESLGKDCPVTHPHQGICPVGWHVPSVDEWTTLLNYAESIDNIANNGATVLKSAKAWNGTDALGMNILPSGLYSYYDYGGFIRKGTSGYYLTTKAASASHPQNILFTSSATAEQNSWFYKDDRFALRCIKD